MKYTFFTDDASEAAALMAAQDVQSALWEYANALRGLIKYDQDHSDEFHEGVEWARKLFYEFFDGLILE